ncbi:hypothetical protein ACFWPX_03325 [Nocardia sp. NPDC058518]|uniref:hypothetical protein n=1 Tax=Nocardia sp. NPDC058518 TaxID=3346534 RepID=UPI003656FFF5
MTSIYAAPTPGTGIHTQLTDMACVAVPGVKEACQLGTVVESAASAVGNSWLDDLANRLMESLGSAMRLVMTWWTAFPSPELATAQGQPAPVMSQIREYTSGLQVIMLTVGIMFAAARLALAKRGGVAGEAQESFLMLARAIFAAATFGALITVATTAGDEFASWVIFDATRGDFDTAVNKLVTGIVLPNPILGSGLLLVLGLLGVIGMLVQLVMLVIRQALLVVVVAVIPIAAAASGTGPGSQAYKRLISWSLAFVLWKPVGALVYAIAFTVTAAGGEDDPHMMLLGVILILMSLIVLPALIRLIAPAVATLGGGGGAGAALAGGAAGIAMSAAGSRPDARRMSEGENSASPSGGGDSPPPSGDGSGARSMSASSGSPPGGSPPSSGGGGPTPSSSSAAAGSGTGAASAGSASGGAAAAGAGPAGAAMLGAQLTMATLQSISSAAQSSIADSSAAGDPDAVGPGEVRR